MSFKDFDALRREQERTAVEPKDVSFVLGGVKFQCVPVVTLGKALGLSEALDIDEHPLQAISALRRFIHSIIVADQRIRFRDVLENDPDISAQDLQELVGWLAEEYFARPTERPADSSDGPLPIGQVSKVVSLEPVTVRAAT